MIRLSSIGVHTLSIGEGQEMERFGAPGYCMLGTQLDSSGGRGASRRDHLCGASGALRRLPAAHLLHQHLGAQREHIAGAADDPRPAKLPPPGTLPSYLCLGKTFMSTRYGFFIAVASPSLYSLIVLPNFVTQGACWCVFGGGGGMPLFQEVEGPSLCSMCNG